MRLADLRYYLYSPAGLDLPDDIREVLVDARYVAEMLDCTSTKEILERAEDMQDELEKANARIKDLELEIDEYGERESIRARDDIEAN